MESGRRPGEVAFLGDSHESLELPEFHSVSLLLNLIRFFYWTSGSPRRTMVSEKGDSDAAVGYRTGRFGQGAIRGWLRTRGLGASSRRRSAPWTTPRPARGPDRGHWPGRRGQHPPP